MSEKEKKQKEASKSTKAKKKPGAELSPEGIRAANEDILRWACRFDVGEMR